MLSTNRASVRVPRRQLLAACALLALTGCSNSSGGSSTSTTAPPSTTTSASASTSASGSASASASAGGASSTITIHNFAFNPAKLTVKPGTKVTVMNKDSVTHTVTATTGKAFATGDIAAGKTATFTAPSKTGTFPYICSIHTFMKGSLTVA